MTAVICLGTVGYGVALTFMFFGAPDLAAVVRLVRDALLAEPELRPLLERAGCQVALAQHQAWRGAPLAEGTRLAPLNPVLVLKGRLP